MKLSSAFDVINAHEIIKNDTTLSSNLLSLCHKLVNDTPYDVHYPAIKAARDILKANKLGPIVFTAPELGRWSTVGGLGVMVDELTVGLADLGEDVYVISPYYDKNRKGETGYLAKDPAGIHYLQNI
jgi:hypothetical protein